MGSGGTNTISQSAPPANVQQAYNTVMSTAQGAASTPYVPYAGGNPSAYVAPLSGQQQQGMAEVGAAQGMAQPYFNQAQSDIQASTAPLWSSTQQFSPGAVNQYYNPYVSDVVNATQAEFNNQNQQEANQITGNAASQGALGGNRVGVEQGIASGQEQLAQAPQIAGLEQSGYNSALGEFNTQQQAQLGANEANSWLNSQAGFGMSALGQSAEGTALTGASALMGAGGLQQQETQAQMNVPLENYQASQAYPFQTSQFLTNAAEGIGGQSGGTTSTTPSTLSTLTGAGMDLGTLGLLGYGAMGSSAAAGLTGVGATDAAVLSGMGADAATAATYGSILGMGMSMRRGGAIGPSRSGFASGGALHGFASGGVPSVQQTLRHATASPARRGFALDQRPRGFASGGSAEDEMPLATWNSGATSAPPAETTVAAPAPAADSGTSDPISFVPPIPPARSGFASAGSRGTSGGMGDITWDQMKADGGGMGDPGALAGIPVARNSLNRDYSDQLGKLDKLEQDVAASRPNWATEMAQGLGAAAGRVSSAHPTGNIAAGIGAALGAHQQNVRNGQDLLARVDEAKQRLAEEADYHTMLANQGQQRADTGASRESDYAARVAAQNSTDATRAQTALARAQLAALAQNNKQGGMENGAATERAKMAVSVMNNNPGMTPEQALELVDRASGTGAPPANAPTASATPSQGAQRATVPQSQKPLTIQPGDRDPVSGYVFKGGPGGPADPKSWVLP